MTTKNNKETSFKKIRKPPYISAAEFELIKAAIKSGKGDEYPPIPMGRRVAIVNYMIGYKFLIGNGSKKKKVITVTGLMVGYKFGDFYSTRTFTGHNATKAGEKK